MPLFVCVRYDPSALKKLATRTVCALLGRANKIETLTHIPIVSRTASEFRWLIAIGKTEDVTFVEPLESSGEIFALPFAENNRIGAPAENLVLLANITYNLCLTKFADVYGDLAQELGQQVIFNLEQPGNCAKTITSAFFAQPEGFRVQAQLTNFTEKHKIFCFTTATTFSMATGALRIEITNIQGGTPPKPWHQLFTVYGDEYRIVANSRDIPNYGVNMMIAAGPAKKYIFYQPSAEIDLASVAIQLKLDGDCPANVWQGLTRNEQTHFYGDAGQVCGEKVYRTLIPDPIYGRYLTFEIDEHSGQCNATMFTKRPARIPSYAVVSAGVLTSYQYVDAKATTQTMRYYLRNTGNGSYLTFELLGTLPAGASLTVDEQKETKYLSNTACSTQTYSHEVWVNYNWTCSPLVSLSNCQSGLLLRYTAVQDAVATTTTKAAISRSSLGTPAVLIYFLTLSL
ncbi:unnamed protein product, partial [Mesorhabditis spiculigera]